MDEPATRSPRLRGLAAFLPKHFALSVPAGALLVLGLGVVAWALVSAQQARQTVAEQNRTLVATERLLSTLKDLETGERGYALTGVPSYLEPYEQATAALDGAIKDAGTDKQAAERLVGLVEAKRAFATQVIAARRNAGIEAAIALILTGQDKASMDEVRTAVATLQDTAHARIDSTERAQARLGPVLQTIAAAAILAAFAAILCRHR